VRFVRFLKAERLEGAFGMEGVVISSSGGDLFSAVKLGKTIGDNGFNTVVATIVCNDEGRSCDFAPGECYGGCAYMFAGGARRMLHDGSKLGVHRFSAQDVDRFIAQTPSADGILRPADPVSATQFVQAALSAYLDESKVSLKLLEIAARNAPGNRDALSDQQLRALNLHTQVIAPPTTWQLTQQEDSLRLVGAHSASETGGSAYVAYTLTFACSRARPGRVSADYTETGSTIAAIDIEKLRGWVTSGPGIRLDDDWLAKTVNARFSPLQKSGKDTLHFSLFLTNAEFLRLARAKKMFIGIGMPSGLDGGPGSSFDLAGAHKSLGLLLRNCEK
jgi:hypothetical protein